MIWAAVAGCLLVSFIFSGIEAGILSMNRVRLKHRLKLRVVLRDEGRQHAKPRARHRRFHLRDEVGAAQTRRQQPRRSWISGRR